jgi:hypothetical protein
LPLPGGEKFYACFPMNLAVCQDIFPLLNITEIRRAESGLE